MKKKMLTLIILFIALSCFSGLFPYNIAKADETTNMNQIFISQYPSKMTYSMGENLDLTDMVLIGSYMDGTSTTLTDYEVVGYDCNKLGIQTVLIKYQEYVTYLNITVLPAKVTNISASSKGTNYFALTWDTIAATTKYEIYVQDVFTGAYNLTTTVDSNSITINCVPGTIQSYKICALEYIDGILYRSELSEAYTAATVPDIVTGLTVTATTSSSIALTWNVVPGATGYAIYRSPINKTSYSYCGETSSSSYIDKEVASGTGYKYMVGAYTLNKNYLGSFSSAIEISTNPAKVVLRCKAGDQKIRINWGKVNGASSYDIYVGDDSTGFSLLTTANNSGSFLLDGLITGETYSFYAIAHLNFNGVVYDSQASDITLITMEIIKNTSTDAKLFPTISEFKYSYAYTRIPYFKKYVNYSKSVIIPGLVTTNIGGFSSTTMCPQGITFAGDYLLVTAYDMASEENSVVYVMDKSSKELLSTLILPSKTHAGSITYDGSNIWIPTGTKVSTIPFSDIEAAVYEGSPYAYINYSKTFTLGITVSYITYFDDKLWAGSYNELQSTNMYSYYIENKDTDPSITEADIIIMPTRVQGVAFTSKGSLILSRSCQLYKGLRGYMRQLDVYQPAFSENTMGTIPLGEIINSVEMPSMNEDIAVNGSYLYVNFESGVFQKSSYKMDRICAFKLTSITKKTT